MLGHALLNCMEVIPEIKTAIFKVTREDWKRFNLHTGDTEGIVNYGLSIKGIEIAALVSDKTDLVRISMRSAGTLPVNGIAKEYFNGGGHMFAAAGNSTDPIMDTIKKLKKAIKDTFF